jgi:predicted O-methyltransferase YrrM
MSVSTHLHNNGFTEFEGHSGEIKEQQARLKELCSKPSIQTILEIGFNGGHSAELFLSNSSATVLSFDLGVNPYVQSAKEYIDAKYTSRHTLILGNSMETVPQYLADNPNTTFDFIFIDGGHDYEIALADLTNCRKLSKPTTVVVMDDVIISKNYSLQCNWTLGPSKTWAESIMNGMIRHTSAELYYVGRGMAWGTFS